MKENPLVPGKPAPDADAITVVPIDGISFKIDGQGGVYAMIITSDSSTTSTSVRKSHRLLLYS
jgi:hypothetical protein